MLGNLGGSNYGATMMDLDGDGTPKLKFLYVFLIILTTVMLLIWHSTLVVQC